MIPKKKKVNLIDKFKEHPKDSGSAPVQIALLTERIGSLTEHLKNFKKDFHSRRGLLMLVGRRRRPLSYFQEKDPQGYTKLVKELKLKK